MADDKDQAASKYVALAEGVDEIREHLRAVVAGVMADGFDEAQARVIVVGFFASITNRSREEEA